MFIFKSKKELQKHLSAFGREKTIGFTPTMGALHQAHISLIEISKKENDFTICSIFVNPKQFNKKEDLVKYPRNTAADLVMLEGANCDIVFIPSVDEMYPKEVKKEFNFGRKNTS